MLKKVRVVLALLSFVLVTMLFLDFTGFFAHHFAWMAKLQFLPAVLALNFGVVLAMLLLTLLFGRIYCSVICPMGVMQDCFSHMGGWLKKNRFHYTKNPRWIRWGMLALFVILMVAGLNAIAVIIAPYSAYGRIASHLFAPIYDWVNNLCATIAENHGSYAFYKVDRCVRATLVLIVALVAFIVVALMSFFWGRLWCNTICPVGTVLGFFSKFSLFRPVIDASKCNGCTKCARNCKSQCIDPKEHHIDMSRCVACFDCIENCKQNAIKYQLRTRSSVSDKPVDESRRKFVVTTAAVAAGGALMAEEQKVDGGMAVILDREVPKRNVPLKPFGSKSVKHFSNHCTSCQLCVSECPNQVLRPSKNLSTFMQPEMGFENGYCRPECTRCSEVCPAGAIQAVTPAMKTAIHIGVAVYLPGNCVVNTDGVKCGNCARHCPAGAITMVPKTPGEDPELPMTLLIPAIDENRCIGCGACENLCPARPQGAIYVEGREVHIQE